MLDHVSAPASPTSSVIEDRPPGPGSIFNSLEGIVHFLIRNLHTLGVSTGVAVLLAIVYVLTAQPIFTAQTQLLLDPRLPQVVRELSEARTLLDRSEIDNQIALIRSEQIARTALARSKQSADPEATNGPAPVPEVTVADATAENPKLRKEIEAFQRGLTVNRMGASYVLEIAYSSPDPKTAARLANAAADAYIEDQLAARALAARQGSEWLEERIEQLRGQMNMSALRLQEFKARRDYRIIGKAEPANGPAANKQEASGEKPQITLEELESTASTYRKIYESYLQAHTESVQRQSFPIGSARVITRATLPLTASHPKRLRLLLLSIVVGVMVGLGVAFVREGLQQWRALGLGSLKTRERTSHEY